MVNIDNLFKMIARKGITQSKLAEDTSVSTGNISDWKKGKSMPSAIKLDELATYFECSVDYLLGRTNDPRENVVKSGDINGNNNSGNTGAVTIESNSHDAPEIDKFTAEFLKRFERLDFDDKLEIMNLTTQKLKKSA